MLGGIIMKKKVLSIIFASLITASSLMMFSGCGKKDIATPDEATTVATSDEAMTTTVPTTVPKTTVSKEVKDLIDKGDIKVDKDGNITDKDGKKVEVKDGKVEVKTDDGKTVTVKADDVKTTVSNNNSNKGNTEKKEDTNSNTSGNNQKPAKPSNSSNSNQTPAKPSTSSSNNNKPASNTKATEAPKYKYYKHHDAKTVYHEAVTKHHDAVTKHHDKEWVVTGTREEPVYEWVGCNVCNDCGMKLPDANTLLDHLEWEADNGGKGSYHYEKEYVQTGTKTVEDGEWKAAYDEVITPAWTETITPAWTETIPAYDEEVSENDNWDKKVLIN